MVIPGFLMHGPSLCAHAPGTALWGRDLETFREDKTSQRQEGGGACRGKCTTSDLPFEGVLITVV